MKLTRYLFLIISLGILNVSCSSTKPFKLAVLPDTQSCTEAYPHIFKAQTQWLANNRSDIAFVLHEGDITDWDAPHQWDNVVAGFSLIDDKLPYAFVPGNHDYVGNAGEERICDNFNLYMPYDKYCKTPNFGGAYQTGRMENTWHKFDAGGAKWLLICLEFGPRNKVLDWANEVVKQHPDRKVIVLTHAYMYSDDTRMGEGDDWLPQSYGVGKSTGENATNNGEQIWEKFVSLHKNILLVFSGHVLHSGTGKMVSAGVHGNQVYQMLANYQGGVDGSVNGGNGFMRLVTIDVKGKTIDVKSYSPFTTEYDTRNSQQFIFRDVKF